MVVFFMGFVGKKEKESTIAPILSFKEAWCDWNYPSFPWDLVVHDVLFLTDWQICKQNVVSEHLLQCDHQRFGDILLFFSFFLKFSQDWQPPFACDVDRLKFTPRIQRLNELEVYFLLCLCTWDTQTAVSVNRGVRWVKITRKQVAVISVFYVKLRFGCTITSLPK